MTSPDHGPTCLSFNLEDMACVVFFSLFHSFSLYLLEFSFCTAMSFDKKDDSAEQSRAWNVTYSEVSGRPPAVLAVRTAETYQQSYFNDEGPPPSQQTHPKPPVNVQRFAEDLRSMRVAIERLLKQSNQRVVPKILFTYYDFKKKLPAMEGFPIHLSAEADIVLFHRKAKGPTSGQLIILQTLLCAFYRLSDYRCYCVANARLRRQKHETSHARRLFKDLIMSMSTYDENCLLPCFDFFLGLCKNVIPNECQRLKFVPWLQALGSEKLLTIFCGKNRLFLYWSRQLAGKR